MRELACRPTNWQWGWAGSTHKSPLIDWLPCPTTFLRVQSKAEQIEPLCHPYLVSYILFVPFIRYRDKFDSLLSTKIYEGHALILLMINNRLNLLLLIFQLLQLCGFFSSFNWAYWVIKESKLCGFGPSIFDCENWACMILVHTSLSL